MAVGLEVAVCVCSKEQLGTGHCCFRAFAAPNNTRMLFTITHLLLAETMIKLLLSQLIGLLHKLATLPLLSFLGCHAQWLV